MADAGFFKGTSADQDRRFSDKELKLLKTMKFPPEFEKKVDMRKVNLTVIRPWIVKKVIELVGFEDEVVVEYAMGLLEDDSQPTPDPRRMQINLTGFLTNSTPAFMSALWKLLLEAQESPAGVPRTFVEEKKEEMRQAKAGDSRAIEERDRRARLDEIRANEREGRGGGRGRGRGRGRGGRGGFADDRGDRPRDSGWGGRGGLSFTLPYASWPSIPLSPAGRALALAYAASTRAPSPLSPTPFSLPLPFPTPDAPAPPLTFCVTTPPSARLAQPASSPAPSFPIAVPVPQPLPTASRARDADGMDVDRDEKNGREKEKEKEKEEGVGELKIRGQAASERRKDEGMDVDSGQVDQAELARRESELKERALRNKVVRTRKTSANAPSGSGSGSGSGN
ncbi:hypothetical protein BD413DRAFT_495733 [Trametes elegans]|nr:hypothetical protein BD413DRAFT_495733 [Trametes elegans]